MQIVKHLIARKAVAHRRKELCVEDGRGPLCQPVTIETLPDEALLEVFHFYVAYTWFYGEWFRLTRVCRRWRCIIFASPLRLNLSVRCKSSKPLGEMLDTWATFPIFVEDYHCSEKGTDNIIVAFEHNDRVCGIRIYIEKQVSSSVLGRFARAMQDPFPKLTSLSLQSADGTLVLPGTFLGGSAPLLKSCVVDSLPFLALRNLLLSATHLVDLYLVKIPHSGYISPEAMVTCLSAATNLKYLELRFLSPQSRPDRRPPPLIRTILPALAVFHFHGVTEYLEDFISRVNVPILEEVDIGFFHQLTFDVSQLHQFIGRTEALSALNIANVDLDDYCTSVELSQQTRAFSRPRISLSMFCNGSDWQFSFLTQACSSLSPTLSNYETLNVREKGFESLGPGWEDDVENSQWLELFHPFTSVKNLYLSEVVAPLVKPALQELAEERVTDVLPMLQNLYVEGLEPSGPIQEGIGQFVTARQLVNRPVAVEPWDRWPY